MRICLCQAPDRIEVRRRDEATGHGDAVLAADTTHAALILLRRHLRDRDALPQLRELAGRGTQAGEDEVLGVIAAAIGAGRLQLVRSERRTVGGAAQDTAPPAAPPAARRPAVREEQALPAPRPATVAAPPAAAPELADALAQDAQAGTLRAAAEQDRPFCEVCQRGAQ